MQKKYDVAIIGSGPAGLAAAQMLNQLGHTVVVYDKSHRPGGILRYGIPDFKLEKHVLDRRLAQIVAEGDGRIRCGVHPACRSHLVASQRDAVGRGDR